MNVVCRSVARSFFFLWALEIYRKRLKIVFLHTGWSSIEFHSADEFNLPRFSAVLYKHRRFCCGFEHAVRLHRSSSTRHRVPLARHRRSEKRTTQEAKTHRRQSWISTMDRKEIKINEWKEIYHKFMEIFFNLFAPWINGSKTVDAMFELACDRFAARDNRRLLLCRLFSYIQYYIL